MLTENSVGTSFPSALEIAQYGVSKVHFSFLDPDSFQFHSSPSTPVTANSVKVEERESYG